MPFPKLDNCKFFLVGGSVRDKLMGRKPKDMDYVVFTPMTFQQFVDAVEKAGKVYQAKEEFLTVRGRLGGEDVDFAFPRYDGYYSDSRRPDSVKRVVGDNVEDVLRADASRRDFTMNASYQDEDGRVYNFFGGVADLGNKLVKAVGDPLKRFEEDYLRVMRAVRFAVQFDFVIESNTRKAMELVFPKLREVAVERTMVELNKALAANPMRTFELLDSFGFGMFKMFDQMGLNFEVNNKKRR